MQIFFKKNLFKKWMKKFIALLTKEKGKTAINEYANDDPGILRTFYSVHKKVRTILFPWLLLNLFKQRYSSSGKSYKYLKKFIS